MSTSTERVFTNAVELHVDDLLDKVETLRSNLGLTEAATVEILIDQGFGDLAEWYKDWLDDGSQEGRDGSMEGE